MRHTPWLLALLACAGDNKAIDGPVWDDTDTTPPSACEGTASVALTLPEGPLYADVPITITLTHPDAEPATLTLQYTQDGTIFRTPTVIEPTVDLSSSPGGTDHTLTWRTVDDLGYTAATLTLQATARSASCNPWPLARQPDVAVDNTSTPVPTCEIAVTRTEDPVEGLAVVHFTAAHTAAPRATVQLDWSTDGQSWTPARLSLLDCDGDGLPDSGVDVPVGAEPREVCLAWDSQADLDVDATVTLRATCLVQGLPEATHDLSGVTVHNDPAPDPGELIISELMPVPAASDGHYIELHNTSGHILDVHGLWIGRWRQVTPLTSPPDREFTLNALSGVLTVPPGGQILLGKSADPAASGCRPTDLTWPGAFSLAFDSTLVVERDGVEITALPFFQSTGWSFSEGVALGVNPLDVATSSALSRNGWCLQSSTLPGCPAVPSTGENGTPGAPNDPCR